MAVQRTKGVDSARRALQILLQFTQEKPELTVDDLLEMHDISLPSAYRYLSLLREMYLIEERSKGVFVLSPEILQLAEAAERTLDYRAEAQTVLDALRGRTGETALYLRRLNDAAICLAISDSDHAVSISFQPGHVMPLHAGAAAKLLLAEYSKSKRAHYLDAVEPPLSKAARKELEADLDRIKRERFSVSEAEVDEGVWACAAPVRVHGRLIGAITVVAPGYRVGPSQQEKIGDEVKRAAAEFESMLVPAR
ncbi:IclR family transcriptional regulator [Gryllotalpicola koreensis]|uniref:IclR family transcriptional regulator n=1 Tax=Gryllotalpicola koreensis TaxID=993086 RepID=A0ABP7ZR58_9MICO